MGELRKDRGLRLISPAYEGDSGTSPIPFRLFAPPLPYGLGWRYRANARYLTVEELNELVGSGAGVDLKGAVPVYDSMGELLGYQYPGDPLIYKPSQFPSWSAAPYGGNGGGYTGGFDNMEAVQFPGLPLMPNGYPVAPSDAIIDGYFDTQSDTGPLRVWRKYQQNSTGIWKPIDFQDPAYHQTLNGIVMLSNFPGRRFTPYRPARYGYDYYDGWNAGANSIQSFDGDLRTVFQVDTLYGVAVGLYGGTREDVGDYKTLPYAVYAFSVSTGLAVYIMERGDVVAGPFPAAGDAAFEIRRVNGSVRFSIAGQVVYTSPNLSYGPMRVGTSITHGGEGVL